MEKKYEAPLEKNQAIGTLSVYYDGNLLCRADISALQAAELKEGPDIAGIAVKVLKTVGAAAVILALLYVIFVFAVNQMYKKKKNRGNKN